MEAIILAGGFGTRLRQVVPDLPKPMSPIAGQPFLEILLRSLANKGFHRVVLSLGYMADKITSHFGAALCDIELIYEVEELPLGTGGAVRQAISHCNTDHVYVFNGDTFLDLQVNHVEAHWKNNHVPIIIAREVDDTTRYGRLEVSQGKILGFREKGVAGQGLINAGCYVLPVNILQNCQLEDPFSLETDFFIDAVQRQRFDVFITDSYFIDIGMPEDYLRAQTELLRELY